MASNLETASRAGEMCALGLGAVVVRMGHGEAAGRGGEGWEDGGYEDVFADCESVSGLSWVGEVFGGSVRILCLTFVLSLNRM